MKKGIDYIKDERDRQLSEEGYTKNNDSIYVNNQLSWAAVCYVTPERGRQMATESVNVYDEQVLNYPDMWPWDAKHWKPTPNDRIRELSKAGALIAAEIDRLLLSKQINND